MNKKRIIILLLSALIIILLTEAISFILSSRKSLPEKTNASPAKPEEVQTTFENRNEELYDKYSGYWVCEENENLHFELYKDENNSMRVIYTRFDNNGDIVECKLLDVTLNVGCDPLMDENKQYLQIYFGDDPGGWINFELFEGDDKKIAYDNIVYSR